MTLSTRKEAPWEAAKDALNNFAAGVNKYMRELKTDSEEFGRVTRELEQDISEYLAKRERQN